MSHVLTTSDRMEFNGVTRIQILGDRYAFLPHWLINAAVARGWIFVTPDYRLLPETTAHSSLDDVIDAYNWVVKFLHTELKVERGSVAVAGSSAGGWLALGTACFANPKPDALVSIYGMLDFSHDRYTTQGDSIFHAPVTDTTPTLERLKQIRQQTKPQVTTGSELPEALFRDPRFAFITTLHIERLYPDYLTGVPGLREAVVTQGLQAIPQQHRRLFPAEFGFHHGLPPVFLLHGKNDSAVPCSLSERTAARLRDAGVKVEIAFPEDAEHGFDGRSGIKDVDTEGERDEYKTPAIQSLKTVIHFLEQHLQ